MTLCRTDEQNLTVADPGHGSIFVSTRHILAVRFTTDALIVGDMFFDSELAFHAPLLAAKPVHVGYQGLNSEA